MSTFGPQEGPPKVRCLFCEFAFPHTHHDGAAPLLPCRACWIDEHERCDPHTYFCCCQSDDCAVFYLERR